MCTETMLFRNELDFTNYNEAIEAIKAVLTVFRPISLVVTE